MSNVHDEVVRCLSRAFAAIVLATSLASFCVKAPEASETSLDFKRLKDLSLTLANRANEPIGLARIGAIEKGFQRRGFFRVALLPQLEVRDVRVEAREGARLFEVLQELGERIDSLAGKEFTIENFRISGESGAGEYELKAAKASWSADGVKLEGASWDSGKTHRTADAAMVSFTGRAKGLLLFFDNQEPSSIKLSER